MTPPQPTYAITFPDNVVHLAAPNPTNLAQQILARIQQPGVFDVLIPLDDNMQPGRGGWIEAPNGQRVGRFGIRRVGG